MKPLEGTKTFFPPEAATREALEGETCLLWRAGEYCVPSAWDKIWASEGAVPSVRLRVWGGREASGG